LTTADAVTVGYAVASQVAFSWHASMQQLWVADIQGHRRWLRGGEVAVRCPSVGALPMARNRVVRHFLDDRKADWLWCIDTDMGFAPDTVERLLAAADPVSRPVVGALCFAQREVADDGLGGWRTMPVPTIYAWHQDGEVSGFEVRADYPADELVACDGTGAACILIHRGVLERMHARYGPAWYDRIPARDGSVGEDLSFCMRARELAIPIHVHTGVKTSHLKPAWLGEGDYLAALAAAPAPMELVG